MLWNEKYEKICFVCINNYEIVSNTLSVLYRIIIEVSYP